MNAESQSKLLVEVGDRTPFSCSKVTIIGSGYVGVACAFGILSQNVSSEVTLIDIDEKKLQGELMDLQHGSVFLKSAKVNAGTNYSLSANSRVIVITAGARQKEGDSRLDLLRKNLDILKDLVPQLVRYSPNAIFLVVSNPVDILTYITWKMSGLPKHKVIGSGTNLDTSRFRFLISQRLNVAAESCHGFIIGEHGDSSVPVWSGVNVAGARLKDVYPDLGMENDPNNWNEIHKEVVSSAYEIIKLKGYTSWAVALSVANLVQSILRNSNMVHAVSVNAKGLFGIEDDVYISLPCVLGESGISSVVKLQLTEKETQQLHTSTAIMAKYISQLRI